MSTLCAYENYLRDRYVLGNPVHYAAGSSSPKPKSYDREGNEYTWSDEAGDYVRQVGGPGGGRTIRLSEVEKAEVEQPQNRQANADSGQHGSNVVSAVDEKPKRRPANKKKEPQRKIAFDENASYEELVQKHYPDGKQVDFGDLGYTPLWRHRGAITLPDIALAIESNDLMFFDNVLSPTKFDDREVVVLQSPDGNKRRLTTFELFEFIQERLEDNNPEEPYRQDENNIDDALYGYKWGGLPRELRQAVDKRNKTRQTNRTVSEALSILDDFSGQIEFLAKHDEIPGDLLTGLVDCYLGIEKTAPHHDEGVGPKKIFLSRMKNFLAGASLATFVANNEGSPARGAAVRLTKNFLESALSKTPERNFNAINKKAEELGFSPYSVVGVYDSFYTPADYREPKRPVAETLADSPAQEPEPKDIIAREVSQTSNQESAETAIESKDEGKTTTLERAQFDDSGLGLPGKSDVALKPDVAENKDAADFIRRDLEDATREAKDPNAQPPASETKEPIEKPEVSNSSIPEQQTEPVAETVQEQPAKPRPERWTPLKSKMNDDDRRVIENTRKRLNYGLSELAWRLGNAKEKGDVQRVKQLVATAANHYLEQARRAYRSHGGTEALAAFDEALGGDGLTVGQLRDRVVDKFRKIAQMEANDLFKFAGERLDEFESFAEDDSEPISNKEIHLNSIRDKNGKWGDLDDKDSEVTVEDGKPSTLFPDEYFGRRMGSERGLADAVRRALKSMTRKGEYRDSFEKGAEYAVPEYNIGTPTRMGRFLAHGYKNSLNRNPVSHEDYSEQRYQELLEKFPTDRESRKLNNLFKSNNREVNKLIKENEDEYKQSKNKSEVVQRVVDGIRDILSGGRKNGSAETPPSESLRDRTTGEVLETGGTDRPSDGGGGRDYASVIAEEAKKSDIPESRVREELSSSTDKGSKKTNSSNTSSSEGISDWERELEETRKLGYLEVPSTTQGRKRNTTPNSAAKNTNISEPSQISSGNSKTEPHAPSGQDPLVSEGQNTSGEQAPVAKNRRGRPRIVRPSSTAQASGNSEKIAREVEKFEVPKEQLQKRIAEALGQTAKPETNANSKIGAKQGHKKRFSPDYINEDVEKAIQIRDADRRKLSLESIEYMMWLAQNVSGKYGATGLKNFMKRIDVTPTGTTSRKLLNELREYLEAVSASRYNAMTINKMTGYHR